MVVVNRVLSGIGHSVVTRCGVEVLVCGSVGCVVRSLEPNDWYVSWKIGIWENGERGNRIYFGNRQELLLVHSERGGGRTRCAGQLHLWWKGEIPLREKIWHQDNSYPPIKARKHSDKSSQTAAKSRKTGPAVVSERDWGSVRVDWLEIVINGTSLTHFYYYWWLGTHNFYLSRENNFL